MTSTMNIFFILAFLPLVESQSCTDVPDSLSGTWTSTNLGTITISSSRRTLSMTKLFSAQTAQANYFDCVFQSGTQYVFQSNDTVSSFGGNYIVYGCFDFRYSSPYVYYYYLNSDPELGLEGIRMKGFTTTVTSLSQVCETTLDAAEFNTMFKTGFEKQAISAENCPTPLLASSIFTYTDDAATYCSGDNATLTACDDPKYYAIAINSSVCTSTPARPIFYSTNGSLGCLVNVENSTSDVTYVSFYNRDSSLVATTYQFTCAALRQAENNTVYMSIFPTDCISGQSPTVLPSQGSGAFRTYGALLELVPTVTCIPPTQSTTKSWTWLILLMVTIGVLVIIIVVVLCLHHKCKGREKKVAREKPVIVTEEHPLGEMSIALDAPPSLENIPNGYINMETELFDTPRRNRRRKTLPNPIGETSLNLSFINSNWSKIKHRKSMGDLSSDPFTEMDNGTVVALSPEGSKAPKRMQTPRQKSFLFDETKSIRQIDSVSRRGSRVTANGNIGTPLAITDGKVERPGTNSNDAFETKTVKSERSVKSFLAKSVYTPSLLAPSFTGSLLGPSGASKANSVKAPSVKAPSIRAPSLKASSHISGSVKALSVKSKSSKALSVRSKNKPSTLTRIGSITRRTPTSPRKKMIRSKTMAVKPATVDDKTKGMAEFMNAEMTNWGDAAEIGQFDKPKKSARSTISRVPTRASNRTASSPRKSVKKQMTGIPNYFRAVSIT